MTVTLFSVTGDYETALRERRASAKEGDAIAQFDLGLKYEKDEGVLQDCEEAVKWFTKAAEHGHADAISIEKLRNAWWYEKTSQPLAVIQLVYSVGVVVDGRL